MDRSIIQLVDDLPQDNITVKVLNAIDAIAPSQWNNLVGFENSIRSITGETDPQVIQQIRDRAVVFYHDPQYGYQNAVKLYQAVDKADAAIGAMALANKVGEKISFLSFLNNLTPKADTTQTVDLLIKIAVEIIAFCQLNGIPQPNPQVFAATLSSNYQDAALMRMIALVCLDAVLPLGPNFLAKIHGIIDNADAGIVTNNPVFGAVSGFLPGNSTSEKFGFITQGFNAVQGWMDGFVSKTGITPQSIFDSLGNMIQIADDNLDFVAAFVDQVTNYYEHTGIQTVAQKLIEQTYSSMQSEIVGSRTISTPPPSAIQTVSDSGEYAIAQAVEVWDEDEEDWYQATILKVKDGEYFVHYVGYGSSDDEWVSGEDVRVRDHSQTDDNGFAEGLKVKVWDDDDEEWYTAQILRCKRKKYFVHYFDFDESEDEWVHKDDLV